MEYRGYSENELVSNRAALLLYGGNEADRRTWALEAAGNFAAEGPLFEVHNLLELTPALQRSNGVVFVPAVLALGLDGQSQILRCLREREERPKLILGLSMTPDTALQQGVLRDDLSYRLQTARVDLASLGLLEVIRDRRQNAEEALGGAKTLVSSPASRLHRAQKAKKSSGSKKATKNRSGAKKRPASEGKKIKKKKKPSGKKAKKAAKKAAKKTARKAKKEKRAKKKKKR